MAKIDWTKNNRNAKVDWYAEAKEENNRWIKKPKSKKLPKNKEINLGIHEKHDWQVIKIDKGPHAGKIICNTCGGKWVTWLPKGF